MSDQIYRLFASPAAGPPSLHVPSDEFDESDVWAHHSLPPPPSSSSPSPPSSSSKKSNKDASRRPAPAPVSLPMSIPDWSKVMAGRCDWSGAGAGDDGEDGAGVIPPHEFLCRNRGASLSVHEGIGRTLKGRDLSRVRNAIWARTGFED